MHKAISPQRLNSRADLSKAHIVRTINGRQTAIPVNLQNMMQSGGTGSAQAANVTLLPEDILVIPSRKRGFKITDVLGLLSPLAIFAR